LGDIRSLLNDDDYEGGSYSSADLTFKISVYTKEQSVFISCMPWGLNK